jgi:hypothetical protein
MVSVIAMGPKVREFKIGLGDELLRAIKIHSTPSFSGEVKPLSTCRKILRHALRSVEKNVFGKLNSSSPSPNSS